MKNLGAIVTIVLAVIAGAIAFGTLKAKAENTRERIEKAEIELNIQEDRIVDNEKFDIQQSILLETSLKWIDRIEQRQRDYPLNPVHSLNSI